MIVVTWGSSVSFNYESIRPNYVINKHIAKLSGSYP